VACRIKVLGYMEDLRSTYIFAEFLYLYQLTLHPSPNTPLISTLCKEKRETIKTWETINATSTTFSFTRQEPKCHMQHENTKP
jgi:hypothetical protein